MGDGGGGRTPSLVVDKATGTVGINGQLLELPLREFRLLTALAERVGQPVSSEQLLKAVWPEDFEWTAKNDLYVLLSKLRRQIDGDSKFGDNIRNRRGFGYILELPIDEVAVLEPGQAQVPLTFPPSEEPGPHQEPISEEVDELGPVGSLDQEMPAPPLDAMAPAHSVDLAPRRSRWIPTLAASVTLTALVVSTSWAAGYWLSTKASSRSQEISERQNPPSDPVEPQAQPEANEPSRTGPSVARLPQGKKRDKGSNAAAGSSAAIAQTNSAPQREPETRNGQGSTESTRKDPPPPPQPDARLYHLFNPDTDEHYMTTSSATANQKQAQGFESSTEGGVFTSQQQGTSAIDLDDGTVYIYGDPGSAPKGVSVAPLYRLSSSGEVFYTTSSSTANQSQAQGWSRASAGYVTT